MIRTPHFPERDHALTEFSLATLRDRYLLESEQSPQEAFARAATAFADDPQHAARVYDYMSRLWFMAATPPLGNAPIREQWRPGRANFAPACFNERVRGLPISCYLNYVPDSRKGLSGHYDENIWLTSGGGGIGGYWGHVRSNGIKTRNGSKSSGAIPFVKVVDSQTQAFSQGTTRRGAYAAYIDISHPEVEEFIAMRRETGGDAARRCLNLHHGINVPDAFMAIIEACAQDPDADPSWPLIDPHTGETVEVVDARRLWIDILETRAETGEPYLTFIDTINAALPQALKDRGLRVNQSNLCTEITLPTAEDRTAVCCLSSVNLAKWDEWKDHPLFIPDLVRWLDNVLEFFIQNAPADHMARAIHSARRERSIGLGAMGFHDLLQSKSFPFDSPMADGLNRAVFQHIHEQAIDASRQLAAERGEAPDMEGTGMRNAHVLAIAPNASSSILCGGTSPSIEPWRANAFTHKTLSGSFLVKNPHLDRILKSRLDPAEYRAAWDHVITNEGSAQGLECLTDWEKEVFKTAPEIPQPWIVDHAANRQPYVCQAQSVNLFFRQGDSVQYFHSVHVRAWKRGLKSLYYVRPAPRRRAEVVGQTTERREIEFNDDACLSCAG